MPPAETLPPEIRALARRQAMALRDDSWESDVARLVRSIGPATGQRHPIAPPRWPFRVDWRIAAGVVGLIVLALVIGDLRSGEPGTDAAPATVDGGPGIEKAPGVESAAAAAPSSGGRELAIPAVSQVGSRGLIYTLMSARLDSGGSSDTLRLRVALENESGRRRQLLGRHVSPGSRRQRAGAQQPPERPGRRPRHLGGDRDLQRAERHETRRAAHHHSRHGGRDPPGLLGPRGGNARPVPVAQRAGHRHVDQHGGSPAGDQSRDVGDADRRRHATVRQRAAGGPGAADGRLRARRCRHGRPHASARGG